MPDSSKDINDWNEIAEEYTQAVGMPDDRVYLQYKDVLWESLGDLTSKTVLDLGCGHGWLSHYIHNSGATVKGIGDNSAS